MGLLDFQAKNWAMGRNGGGIGGEGREAGAHAKARREGTAN